MRKDLTNRNLFGRNLRRVARHGGLPKDDQAEGGATGTTTPPPAANNLGGNPGDSGTPAGESNNDGQTFDGKSFWDSPDQGTNGAPAGESATNGSSDPGTDLQTTLTNQLNNMKFGDSIMTPEIAAEINQGNFDGFQKRFDASVNQAVRQTLQMTTQIMRPLADQIMQQVRDEFGETLTNRDNNDALVKDFPTAADPRVRPIVDGIFQQALRNTKGNRAEAVRQTKEMIRLTANLSSGDLNLTVAPRNSEDSGSPQVPTNFNWLDELTGR